MSREGPKLYTNKPKKAQLKQSQHQESMGTTAQAASASAKIPITPTPPPVPPKESFARRYRFLWPLLLTVNLGVGAYVFMRTKKKDVVIDGGAEPTTTAAATATTAVSEKPALPAAAVIIETVKVREPIPEDQQRELFKWMLEEKRKVKPKDPEEKKRIDEEKALLKQFIRAKSIPQF